MVNTKHRAAHMSESGSWNTCAQGKSLQMGSSLYLEYPLVKAKNNKEVLLAGVSLQRIQKTCLLCRISHLKMRVRLLVFIPKQLSSSLCLCQTPKILINYFSGLKIATSPILMLPFRTKKKKKKTKNKSKSKNRH